MKDIIIAAVGSWNKEIFKDFKNYKDYRFHFISSKTQLINKLKYVKPKIIFLFIGEIF